MNKEKIQEVINELTDFMLHFTWVSSNQIKDFLYKEIVKLKSLLEDDK